MHLSEVKTGFTNKVTDLNNKVTEFKGHNTDVKKKILFSAGLNVTELAVDWLLLGYLAANHPDWIRVLGPAAANDALALSASYVVNILSSLANLNQERRLLQNENIDTCHDILATTLFHGLGKNESLREKRKERSIAAVSAPAILGTVISALATDSPLLPMMGVKGVATLKLLQGLSKFSQSAVGEVFIRTLGRDKKVGVKEVVVFNDQEVKAGAKNVALAPATITLKSK